jgi:nucleoside-diphosphate-sugar epimerase
MIRDGHRVTAVGRSPDRLRNLASQGAATIALDLFDREAVRRAIANHEAIVNLATHIPRAGLGMFLTSSWKENDRIREHGSALLVDEAVAAGVNVFVQESFAPIYADAGDRWITEDAPTRPVRYNETTLLAETSAHRFARSGGRGVVLRFAFFYGPRDRFTEDVFRYARRGWLAVPGSPDSYISTAHHDDAASAAVVALDLPSGIYNVADSAPMTRRELCAVLAAILKVPEPKTPPRWITRLAGGMGELMSRSQRISNAKLRQSGAWSPRYASSREAWEAVYRSFFSK